MNSSSEQVRTLSLELRRREAVFWAILDTAGEGFITTNERGDIELFNSAAERIFGHSSREILGHPFTTLFEGLDEELLGGGQRQATAIRRNGQLFECEVTLSRVQVYDRDLMILIVIDITERLEREAKSNQSQKLESIGQLACGIAHEINTPTQFVGDNVRFLSDAVAEIFAVLESAQSLIDELERLPDAPPKLAQLALDLEQLDLGYLKQEVPMAIAQSIDGIGRVADIVQAMKNFSHPGSLGLATVDLLAVIQNTLIVSRNEWKYQAELELELDEDLPCIRCSESEISQVVLDMIINACHAIESSRNEGDPLGRIRIAAHREEAEVLIEIEDSGCGITAENQQRVFDPFFTTKGVGKGTGQGLALARSSILAHGGTIELESKPGSGAHFTIHLPICGPKPSHE